MLLPSRLPRLVALLAAAGLAAPAAASASHIQGGSITSSVTADGHLRGTVTFLTTSACTVGAQAYEMPSLTATNPNGVSRSIPLTGTATRCLPGSSTSTGTYDADIAQLWGSAPDGTYAVRGTASARVSGIRNGGGSTAQFDTRVTKDGAASSSSPVLNSGVANVVAKNYPYKQNLNGVDPDGGSVTFSSLAGTGTGPTSDVIDLTPGGLVSMTAAKTNTFANGEYYTYKVRATDPRGDFSERDVLLVVTGDNAPPSIDGLPSSAVSVTAGAGAQTVPFTANDPNGGQTVALSLAAGTPSWVTLNAPAGNPANATLTVDPPASVPAGTYAFNVDGVDSHPTAPLFASESVEVTVVNPAPVTTVSAGPGALSNDSAPSFTFSSDEAGTTFECRLDGGSWSACTSPVSRTGLADGQHTFEVRAVDAAGQTGAAAARTWTVDTVAPLAPTLSSAPSSVAQASSFTFPAYAGDATECQVDGGAWVPCTSPYAPTGLQDGAHTFALRLADAAGNRSVPVTAAWTLDTAAPAAPALIGAPEGTVAATDATITWTGEDGGSFECAVDGGAFAPCASPLQRTGLAAGAHRVVIRQLDAAGNVGAARTVEWTVGDAPRAATPSVPVKVSIVTGARAAVAVQGDAASVGCKVTGSVLSACLVDVYAVVTPARGDGLTVTAARTRKGGRLVRIGRGRVVADAANGAKRLAVDVQLNALGRRLVAQRLTGISAVVRVQAKTVSGVTLKSRTNARLVPQRQLVVPARGLFASGEATVGRAGRALVRSLAARLRTVVSVTCVGHTDAIGTAAANARLGLARAKAICAALRAGGVRSRIAARTAGETQPRATNRTVAGRALNRRVEIRVRYR